MLGWRTWKNIPTIKSPWPEVKARLEPLDDDEIVEALRRDAEIEADPTRAMSLSELDSQIQNHRRTVSETDDRE